MLPEQPSRWLVLVADGSEVLGGEVGRDQETRDVRTRQRLLVDLADWYIRLSVPLAAVVRDIGDRMEELLTPETLSILASVL